MKFKQSLLLYFTIIILSTLVFYQIYNTNFYFSYWSQRDLLRGKELFTNYGIEHWFLGAELSFGGGARIPSGINNIITALLLLINKHQYFLIIGQFLINIALILTGIQYLHNNGYKYLGLISGLTTLLSPITGILIQTYWNPGFLPGIMFLMFSIIYTQYHKNTTTNTTFILLGLLLFIGMSLHLSTLFILPAILISVYKHKKASKLKIVTSAFLIPLLPYLIYDYTQNFSNSKVLFMQANLAVNIFLIFVTNITLLIALIKFKHIVKPVTSIIMLVTINMLFLISHTIDIDNHTHNINSFIYNKNQNIKNILNSTREDILLNRETRTTFTKQLTEETTDLIEITHNKSNDTISWRLLQTSNNMFKIINIKNIYGFLNDVFGTSKNKDIATIIYTLLAIISISLSITKRDNLFILINLLTPLIFYIGIHDITLDTNSSRYLMTSAISISFLFGTLIERHAEKHNQSSRNNITPCMLLLFLSSTLPLLINMKNNAQYLEPKNSTPISNSSIIYFNEGYSPNTQSIANYSYDNSDNNIYNLNTENCTILFDKSEYKEPPEITFEARKYAVLTTNQKKNKNQNFRPIDINAETTIKDKQCNLNLQNRYFFSATDKKMWHFYQEHDLSKKQTHVFKISNKEYYIYLKDEFCVNDCIGILINLKIENNGIYIYSNQLKQKSYNSDFFDSGTIDNTKIILIDKKTHKTKEISIFQGTIGYLGLHSPVFKPIKENISDYDILFITTPNKYFSDKKHKKPTEIISILK